MTDNAWLPRKYDVGDGAKIRLLTFSGDNWQIYDTDASRNVLIVNEALMSLWAGVKISQNIPFKE